MTNYLGTHASVRLIPQRQLATHHSQVLQAPRTLSVCSWPPRLPSAGRPFSRQSPKPGRGIIPLTLNPHSSASEHHGGHPQGRPQGFCPFSSPRRPPGPGPRQVPEFHPLPRCLFHPPDFPTYVLPRCRALAWTLWWWFLCCSVAKLCPTFCDPIDYSMSGFPVLPYLLEFADVHVH